MLTELERSILFNVFEFINRILITRISQLLVINNALKTKVDFRQSIIMLFHTPKTSMLQSSDKKALTMFVFLVLSLFHRSQMVNFNFQGGGVQLLIPYRNSYNL